MRAIYARIASKPGHEPGFFMPHSKPTSPDHPFG
jgi:hypothetical protein